MTQVFELSGRVAIVTGAASGIGRGAARLLAELGPHVIATDLNVDDLRGSAEGLEHSFRLLKHDVTSEADWNAVFDEARHLGRLDILVNNAGIMLDTPFEDAPIEDLRAQYRINVEGPFLGMKGAIELMKDAVARFSALPSIINVSSIYGQIAGARYAAYSASKGAIRMLSKAVANEVASSSIRVNSIHPGPTLTKLGASHAWPKDEAGVPLAAEAVMANWRRLIPMGRMGSVDDIVPVIAFLASDASRYMTGAEIVVDGGYSAI